MKKIINKFISFVSICYLGYLAIFVDSLTNNQLFTSLLCVTIIILTSIIDQTKISNDEDIITGDFDIDVFGNYNLKPKTPKPNVTPGAQNPNKPKSQIINEN